MPYRGFFARKGSRSNGCLLTRRHRLQRAKRGPRRAVCRRLRLCRYGARWVAPWRIDGLQIRGERPGRTRIAGVVLLQEQEQRQTEAALGKSAGAVMTSHATIRKQFGGRFSLIEILGMRCSAAQHGNGDEHKQPVPQLLRRDKPRGYLHAPVVLRTRAALIKRRLFLTRSRIRIEQRQKRGGVRGVV